MVTTMEGSFQRVTSQPLSAPQAAPAASAASTMVAVPAPAFIAKPIATPWSDLDRLFPDAATLAQAPAEAIGRLGIVRQRVGALQALARAVHEGRIRLDGFSVNADDPSGLSLVRNLIIRANVIDPGQPVPEPGIFMLLVAAAAASFTASRMRRRVRPGL